MSFLAGAFLAALVAAVGPFLIHLLNRRRHRTIEWAAMDFLREAIRRNKRMVEIRDLLLLALRTVAVVLFVLAMARPYWVSDKAGSYQGQPIHAVLVMDNSLSMGYTQLDKSLLDVAREKATKFIKDLPKGSDVTIIPLCNPDGWHAQNAYSTREDAIEALDRIEVVDRAARASVGAELARRACKEASEIPTKRIVFIGDMQEQSWSAPELSQYFEDLEDVQSVQVGPTQRENTAVTEFTIRDGIADNQTPAVFTGTISHVGQQPRERVRVTLTVGETVADERFVDLVPGQKLQVVFKHKFEDAGTAADPLFVAARLELTEDRLPGDDFRVCVVPVVAQVPVLYIDQLGENEKPGQNQYGETYPLRRLLAPRDDTSDEKDRLVDSRHRSADQVSQDDLKDARLVVIAGIRAPSSRLVDELRQYVMQGGRLLIAAGADFDPQRWNEVAWQDGAGILPAPLRGQSIGQLPTDRMTEAPKFRLAANTFKDDMFVTSLAEREQQELLLMPFFYKAVGVDESALANFDEAERARLNERITAQEEYAASEKEWAELERRGNLTPEETDRRDAARRAMESWDPTWLSWTDPFRRKSGDLTLEQQVAHARPRVMGRYDNGEVFGIRRAIGEGEVVMLTSGCYPEWNNIATDYAVLIFDQILRGMLSDAIPQRTLAGVNEIVLPINSRDQSAEFTIIAPGEKDPQPIPVEAIGENEYGVVVRSLGRRGTYEIQRRSSENETADSAWVMALACNGPAEESQLDSIDQKAFEDRLQLTNVRWLNSGDEISLEGKTYLGHDVWKYLLLGVLVCLLVEMFLLMPKTAARIAEGGNPRAATT